VSPAPWQMRAYSPSPTCPRCRTRTVTVDHDNSIKCVQAYARGDLELGIRLSGLKLICSRCNHAWWVSILKYLSKLGNKEFLMRKP